MGKKYKQDNIPKNMMRMHYNDYEDNGMVFAVKKENKHYYLLLHLNSEWQHYRSFAELLHKIANNPEVCIKIGKPAVYNLSKTEENAINRVQELVVKVSELEEKLKTDEERNDEVPC